MQEGKDGEAAQKLDELAKQLADLDSDGESESLQEQLARLQAARKAVCKALDGAGQPGSGPTDRGQPVPASGRRPESEEGPTKSKEEWARSKLDKGKLQVIDHVPGGGFKGPRKPDEMVEDIRRAAQDAPEAIDRQRLPRSAGDMAKGYFEKLRGPDKK
jgi:hypothetical protein